MGEIGKLNTYRALGVMSGTSLDGLDLALVELQLLNDQWSFDLLDARAVSYSQEWQEQLKKAIELDQLELDALDQEFGNLIANEINRFLTGCKYSPDFIASHGHTVFHQPEKGLTKQIGNGHLIHTKTGLPLINNFRAKDVSLGGQGAPLVPIGDRHLFSQHEFCLNLGGIANVSFENPKGRIAFDICPINMALNYLTEQLGLPYDDGGKIATSGSIHTSMYAQLNKIAYCRTPPPKSLGYEDFLEHWKPIIDETECDIKDKLRTVIEHAAYQIARAIKDNGTQKASMMATGGGAFNKFLMSRLADQLDLEVIIPERDVIEFKEAIVFALLGVLRFRNEPNCLASVTGAKHDNCGGEMYGF